MRISIVMPLMFVTSGIFCSAIEFTRNEKISWLLKRMVKNQSTFLRTVEKDRMLADGEGRVSPVVRNCMFIAPVCFLQLLV